MLELGIPWLKMALFLVSPTDLIWDRSALDPTMIHFNHLQPTSNLECFPVVFALLRHAEDVSSARLASWDPRRRVTGFLMGLLGADLEFFVEVCWYTTCISIYMYITHITSCNCVYIYIYIHSIYIYNIYIYYRCFDQHQMMRSSKKKQYKVDGVNCFHRKLVDKRRNSSHYPWVNVYITMGNTMFTR